MRLPILLLLIVLAPALPTLSCEAQALPRSGRDVVIDGSSTVYPIADLVVRELARSDENLRIHLGVSGTGGGFSKFCRGVTDISDASRPIQAGEIRACEEAGIRFLELPIAFDGVSVVVHRSNDWTSCLTLDELGRIWKPGAEDLLRNWSDVRPGWPSRPMQLYAPGKDSGTFDFFTRAIVGQSGVSRPDFVGSEDDYLLAQDIADDSSDMSSWTPPPLDASRRTSGA